MEVDNNHGNTKYVLQQILNSQETKHKNDLLVHRSKSINEILNAWNVKNQPSLCHALNETIASDEDTTVVSHKKAKLYECTDNKQDNT